MCKKIAKEYKNIDLPEWEGPDDNTVINRIMTERDDIAEPIETPEPYCFVIFTIVYPYGSHIGLVLKDCKRFIHALAKRNVTVDKLDSPFWNKRIKGFYRWKD